MLRHFAALFALCILGASPVGAVTVLSENFDGVLDGRIGGVESTESVGGFAGKGGFDGSFLRNTSDGSPTTAKLTGLAPHSRLTISFDLAVIDTWDGPNAGRWGPDFFNITLDEKRIYQASFKHRGGSTVLTGSGDSMTRNTLSGSSIFGNRWNESGWKVAIDVAHTAPAADLAFFASGAGWQGGNDESWAIDNLNIAAVPLPASLPLLVMGLAGLGIFRRRR